MAQLSAKAILFIECQVPDNSVGMQWPNVNGKRLEIKVGRKVVHSVRLHATCASARKKEGPEKRVLTSCGQRN